MQRRSFFGAIAAGAASLLGLKAKTDTINFPAAPDRWGQVIWPACDDSLQPDMQRALSNGTVSVNQYRTEVLGLPPRVGNLENNFRAAMNAGLSPAEVMDLTLKQAGMIAKSQSC